MNQFSKGELRAELASLVKPASVEPPAVLYHYTSAESLKKILETKRLLATHFEFTNDPTELRYGHELVVEQTTRVLASVRSSSAWAEPIVSRVLKKMESTGFHDDMPTFVTCLSADGDSLGQWRAYAQDGRGYAIGFDTKNWEYQKSNGTVGTVLVECLYDHDEMTSAIAEQQRGILEQGSKPRRGARDQSLLAELELEVEKALYLTGAFATLRLKNRGFIDEKEWRLVALPDEAPVGKPNCQCVREIGGVFVPAIALKLSQDDGMLPLSKIVMGPCHAQEGRTKSAEYGLRELLRLTESDVDTDGFIESSRIPYRARPSRN